MIILVWKSYCWRILLYFSFALLFIPFSSSAAIIYLHFVCLSLGTHPSPYLYFLTLLFITLTCKATLVHWNTLLFMSEGISRCLCVIRQQFVPLFCFSPTVSRTRWATLGWSQSPGRKTCPRVTFLCFGTSFATTSRAPGYDKARTSPKRGELESSRVTERVYAIELHYGKCRYAVSLEFEPYLGLKSGYICLCCVEFDHSFF